MWGYDVLVSMNEKASNARKHSPLSGAIAAQLRAERAIANMTVAELAKRSGVSKNTLMQLLNAQRTADVTQLDAICRALDVSLIDLFQRADARLNETPADKAHASGQ